MSKRKQREAEIAALYARYHNPATGVSDEERKYMLTEIEILEREQDRSTLLWYFGGFCAIAVGVIAASAASEK